MKGVESMSSDGGNQAIDIIIDKLLAVREYIYYLL